MRPSGTRRARFVLGPAIFFPVGVTTYVIPYAGWYRVCALGAGGSGAACLDTTHESAATGGAGGSFACDAQYFPEGSTLTLSIGAGGAGVASGGTGTGSNGNAGGQTTVTLSGVISLTAPGGGGGGYFVDGGGPTKAGGAAGAAGSGGSAGYAGGRGGDANGFADGAWPTGGTGGGAAGSLRGAGGRGGDITGNGLHDWASGGGACGGFHGGDINTTSSTAPSGGAGTGGNARDVTTSHSTGQPGGPNILGIVDTDSIDGESRTTVSTSTVDFGFDSFYEPFGAGLTGGGSTGGTTTGGGAGAGQGGCDRAITPPAVGAFMGGGAGHCEDSGVSTGSLVVLGGGSGGVSSYGSTATSGRGGNGIVAIERIG